MNFRITYLHNILLYIKKERKGEKKGEKKK